MRNKQVFAVLICVSYVVSGSATQAVDEVIPKAGSQAVRFVGRPEEVRNLIGLPEVPPSQVVIQPPEIRAGVPESVKRLAEQYVRDRGQELTGLEAVRFVLNEIQLATKQTGNIEAALDTVGPEAIIIANALLRPALVVCDDGIREEVPEEWAAALKGKEPMLADILRSVGLVSCQHVLRLNTVESDYPDPVGTAFVVAPGVLMTNRHVALEFAANDGAFRAIPGSELEPSITINFAAEKCSSIPRVYRISRVLHIEPEPGPDVALLKVEDPKGELPSLPFQKLIPDAPLENRDVLTPGYPFDDFRNPRSARLKVFGSLYGVKRLSPGSFMPDSGKPGPDGKTYLFHDCSTLGGNSGSPVVDLETGVVYGLHFGGVFGSKNVAWPIWRVYEVPSIKRILDESEVRRNN
jgi:hypothetical protein